MDMPKVAKCDAKEKGGAPETRSIGAVGACKEKECKYNDLLGCSAPEGIDVSLHAGHADCATFRRDKNLGL